MVSPRDRLKGQLQKCLLKGCEGLRGKVRWEGCCKGKVNKKQIVGLRKDIEQLLKRLKKEIGNEYRASEEDTLPSMLVTVGAAEPEITGEDIPWGYQTGDNSYTGGAYGFPHWAVIYLYRRSNCKALAADAVQELAEAFPN